MVLSRSMNKEQSPSSWKKAILPVVLATAEGAALASGIGGYTAYHIARTGIASLWAGAAIGGGTGIVAETVGRIFKKDITVSKNVQTATGEQAIVTETATNVPLIEVPDAWLALKKRANNAAQMPVQTETI
jgi:hypothetical protein